MFFFFSNSPNIYSVVFSFYVFFLPGIWLFDSYWEISNRNLALLRCWFWTRFAHLHAIVVRKRKVMEKWIEVCKTSFFLVKIKRKVNKYRKIWIIFQYSITISRNRVCRTQAETITGASRNQNSTAPENTHDNKWLVYSLRP